MIRNLAVIVCMGFLLWIVDLTGSPLMKAISYWSMVLTCAISAMLFAYAAWNWLNATKYGERTPLQRFQEATHRWLSYVWNRARRRIKGD